MNEVTKIVSRTRSDKNMKALKLSITSHGFRNNFSTKNVNISHIERVLCSLLDKKKYASKDSNPKANMKNMDRQNSSISTKDSSSITIKKSIEPINKNINDNFEYSKKNYCNYYPVKNEMKKTADKMPIYFPLECFHGINKYHNDLGNKSFFNIQNNNIFCKNNDSYQVIERKDHLFINHAYNKNINIGNKMINSAVVKFRNKNTTFIYYK